MDVNRISFDDLKSYWIEVDHFGNPKKKIREVVRRLGVHESSLDDPCRISYGLFDNGRLIGVTHLVEWSDRWLRYRTINVRRSYRGRDLGWFLLRSAVNMDWQAGKHLDNYVFGWVKRDHLAWSLAHNFKPFDERWHDDHTAVIKPLREF
jgi:hypothetical protein